MTVSDLMLPLMIGFSAAMLLYVVLYLAAAATLAAWGRIERRLEEWRAR